MHSTHLIAAGAALLAFAVKAAAFDAMYERTPVGDIEVKVLPERVALSAAQEGSYFDHDNRMFSVLFNYIKKNDVAMTVPVEAEIEDAEMRFFAGGDDADAALGDTLSVRVEKLAEREVVSVGLRGAYRKELFERGRKQLESWLRDHPRYQAAGPAYAVYWHGPYVPGPFKRSEVHLPVVRVKGDVAQAVP